jgi:hypothetical protein
MLKKVTILAATLMLLLAAAQLALAQQDTGTGQPPQDGQAPAPDPAQQETGQQAASQPQTQPAGEGQAPAPDLDGLMHLNQNSNLVVDCQAVSERLAQLNQLAQTQANDPQFQPVLARAQDLAQLCADSGFTPSGAGGSATPTVPSDGGTAAPTAPPAGEATDAPNPSGTG